MKVSRAQAEQNRERIVEAAAQLFRDKGFDGVGLNELMQSVGLTRGGFYGHFESKQDLAVKACREAFSANAQRWELEPQADMEALVRFYLSDAHRDNRAQGCTLAALSGDVARQGPELRTVIDDGVANFLRALEARSGGTATQRRETALATLATLVGALILSRAVADTDLSLAIRDAAARAVLARAG